jgi:hypothetical protein
MTVSINGTTGLVFNDASTQNTAASGFGFKNRLINSAMMIDQRNAGASVTPASFSYTLDRWRAVQTTASKFSVQQNAGSVTPPVGFANYLGTTSLSAYSLVNGDVFVIYQHIEGFNTADLGFGTANASSVTLSFWVRSSLTGTFGGVLKNGIGNRSYPFVYTINSANTWEQKSVTISGDTTGTWVGATNGTGMSVAFSIGTSSAGSGTAGAWVSSDLWSATGATSVVGTNGATFYITGVQLEKGSTATSFDYRPYGTELALCQRYYYRIGGGTGSSTTATRSSIGYGFSSTTTSTSIGVSLPVTMRAVPTLNFGGTLTVSGAGYAATPSDVTLNHGANTSFADLTFTVAATTAALPRSATVRTETDPDAFVDFSAEL